MVHLPNLSRPDPVLTAENGDLEFEVTMKYGKRAGCM